MAKSGLRHIDIGPELTRTEWESEESHELAHGTSFPASPGEKQLFYRDDQHKWYVYNGSSWIEVGGGHDRQHSIISTADHTSGATSGKILKADANGLPVDATNTDTEVGDAVTKKHSQLCEAADFTKLDGIEAGADVTANHDPKAHKTSHENGGGDEVSVAGLSGLLTDDQHVIDAEVQAIKLDDFAAPDDNTDLDASGAKHGLMPKADKSKLDGIEALADVTGSNPPQAHKTSHQNGGADEISVAGLSGELTDDQPPKDHASDHEYLGSDEPDILDLFLARLTMTNLMNWKNTDAFTQNKSGSGSINLGWTRMELHTGVTINSIVSIYADDPFYFSASSARRHKVQNRIYIADDPANEEARIGIFETPAAPSATQKHIGWEISSSKLYASNADGTTQTKTEVASLSGTGQIDLFFINNVNDGSVYFYKDHTLVATHTTNIPTTSTACYFLAYLKNLVASTKRIRVYPIGAYQKA